MLCHCDMCVTENCVTVVVFVRVMSCIHERRYVKEVVCLCDVVSRHARVIVIVCVAVTVRVADPVFSGLSHQDTVSRRC